MNRLLGYLEIDVGVGTLVVSGGNRIARKGFVDKDARI